MEMKKALAWLGAIPTTFRIYGALALVTLCAYLPTFWAPFVFDDEPVIVRFIRTGGNPFNVLWSHTRWVGYWITLMIGSQWGARLVAFRTLALTIHLLIGLFLFLLLKRVAEQYIKGSLFQRRGLFIATVTTALYLLHPANTHTVGYISQMELEGMALLSIVLALYLVTLYSTATTTLAKGATAFILVAMMPFAAGTKEIIIILPALVLLFDWFFLAQGSAKKMGSRALLYIGMTGALFGGIYKQGGTPVPVVQALTAQVELPSNRGNQLVEDRKNITAYRYCITQWRVIMHYLRIYVCPYPLSFDYSFTLAHSLFEPTIFLSFLVLLGLFALSLVLFMRNKIHIFSFALWWFFVSLAPRSTIIPSWELAVDYKAFIAGLGLIIFFGYGLAFIYEQIRPFELVKRSFRWAAVGLVLLFSFRVFDESLLRTDLIEFWRNSLHHAPKKARLWNNYAAALSDRARHAEAAAAFETAIALDARYAEPLINLGIYYQAIGNKQKAWEYYNKAIPIIEEPHAVLYSNVGTLYLEEKKHAEAERAFKIAIELNQNYAEAYGNLGFIYAERGETEKAINMFYAAMARGCMLPVIKLRCAEELLKSGRNHEAARLVGGGNQNDIALFAQHGQVLYQSKQYDRALIYYSQCVKAEPQNALMRYNLGLCLLALQKWESAEECFAFIKDEKDLPFVRVHYIKALAESGKKGKASVYAQRVLADMGAPKAVKNELHALAQEYKFSL